MLTVTSALACLVLLVVCSVGLIFHEGQAAASTTRSFSSSSWGVGRATNPDENGASDPSYGRTPCLANGTPLEAAAAAIPRLNDGTIDLSPCVYRPWVFDHPSGGMKSSPLPPPMQGLRGKKHPYPPPPPYKVLLTNFRWNHPDQAVGLNATRSVRSREFVTGIVNQPYFDPTDWDEVNRRVENGADLREGSADTRYYVFLDVETCPAVNYPVYGGGRAKNLDSFRGRGTHLDRKEVNCRVAYRCPSIRRVLESPLFRSYPNHTKLLFFDCRGNSMPWEERKQLLSPQFAVASYSAGFEQHDTRVDQGLAAPAVTKIELTDDEARDVDSCDAERNRAYLFTFVGSVRNTVRSEITRLHDPSRGVIALTPPLFQTEFAGSTNHSTFPNLLRSSIFAGAPIGDNRFSYRFTEVLAAGAIPVVHSDGWVLPFRPELVNWTECLIHLPESSVPDTIDILRNTTVEQRCRMRKRCREIYTRYMADGEGTIRGILDGLEIVWANAAVESGRSPPLPSRHRP